MDTVDRRMRQVFKGASPDDAVVVREQVNGKVITAPYIWLLPEPNERYDVRDFVLCEALCFVGAPWPKGKVKLSDLVFEP